METTTDTENTKTLFDNANSQLQTLLFHIVTATSHVFSPVMKKSLHATVIKSAPVEFIHSFTAAMTASMP